MSRKWSFIGCLVLVAAVLTGCSTKKNTPGSRFWHAFNARFNTYYNGEQAYIEGNRAKEEGIEDDYTQLLPFFMAGNGKAASIGKSNYETAVTKCQKAIQLHSIKRKPVRNNNKKLTPKERAYRNRTEFNPFLKNAWLLMGKAQFQKGSFEEASATFSYITRHYAAEPLVAQEARTWLARCYTELGWYYDAEDVLQRFQRDSVNTHLQRENSQTMASLLLAQERFAEALPHLQRAVRQERRKRQKARLYFLLGQVNEYLDRPADAYKAYGKCIRQHPPYLMSFNARIRQTEVLADGRSARGMIKRLKRMSRSQNNAEYLDQVYYAMGNIYLSQHDTLQAISAYEQGRSKAKRSGIEKGFLVLRLGQLYWIRKDYEKAQACYREAVGLIDREREEYAEVELRSKVLDELVPHTTAIHLQDSLLALADMPETERNAAIDRVIADLKKKEEEARKAKRDSLADAIAQQQGANRPATNLPTNNTSDSKEWYFYNPTLVAQGKQLFQRQWGKRKLEDNWRRSNRTVLALEDGGGEVDYEKEDSLLAAQAAADSLAEAQEAVPDSAQNDPHERAYYLKDIPFTPEQKAAAYDILKTSLYQAGLIEKDKLQDFALADETLRRLYKDFPDFEPMDELLYQRFLLYMRWGRQSEAEEMKRLLREQYAGSILSRKVNDPNYLYLARYGVSMEDSLYQSTYEAYRRNDVQGVARGYDISTRQFADGINRPKFIFLHALTRLLTGERDSLVNELEDLVKNYPESDVSEMAGMIVKGLRSGRTIGSGTFNLGSIWDRRTAEASEEADSLKRGRQLSAERNTPFVYVLAFVRDSLNADQVLYDLARFNFSGFYVRNFDLQLVDDGPLRELQISGFNNYDEAHAYAQKVMTDAALAAHVRKGRVVLISADNLPLLGTAYSFDDYRKFYDEHFAPLPVEDNLRLDQQTAPAEPQYEEETPADPSGQSQTDDSRTDDTDTGGQDDDGGEWY